LFNSDVLYPFFAKYLIFIICEMSIIIIIMVAQSNHGNVHVYMIYCYQSCTTSVFIFLRQISWCFPTMRCTCCVHMLYWSLIVFQQIRWRCLFLLGDSWASHKDTERKGIYYNCFQCSDKEENCAMLQLSGLQEYDAMLTDMA